MKTSILVSIGLIVLAFAATSASAQTVYTYAGGNNGTWSTDGNWTSSNGGTTFPGSGGVAGNTDVADINNVTANQNVDYDSGSSGFLGSLNITETSAFTNEVTLQKSLTLTDTLTLGATGGGTAEILVGSSAATSLTDNAGITVGSGGFLGTNFSGSTISASKSLTVNVGGELSTVTGGNLVVTNLTLNGVANNFNNFANYTTASTGFILSGTNVINATNTVDIKNMVLFGANSTSTDEQVAGLTVNAFNGST
jgi:hypothetical protein